MPSYRYTGYTRLMYPAYRDLATGKMLMPDPGGVYEMQSVTLQDPVPPNDGRWELIPDTPPPPPLPTVMPPPPPAAPPAAPEPPADDSPAE